MPTLEKYAHYFLGAENQFIAIAASLCVLGGLAALGRLISGRNGLAEADLFAGWAPFIFLMIAANSLFGLPFSTAFWPFAAVCGSAMLWLVWRERRIGPDGFWRVLVIAAPLLILASARMASEWDEFSHWLPTVRYVFEAQAFDGTGDKGPVGFSQGYPYAWVFLPYAASMISGQLIEGVGGVLNILLLLVFGTGAARVCFAAAGREMPNAHAFTWIAAVLACLAATLLNPTFVQKVILTFYAEASTAAAVGIGTVLSFFLLRALSGGEAQSARAMAWQLGLVLAVLINIKQTNLVLVVMLLGGLGAVVVRDPSIKISAFIARLPSIVLPAILLYGLWRYHLTTHFPGGAEPGFRPFEQWNVHLLWPIFERMLIIASKKGAYFGIMAIAVVLAVGALFRFKGDGDRLAVLIGVSFLGFNAFLFLTYVAYFGENDAVRAASFWRYNHHLGLMAVVFGAFWVGTLWRRYLEGRRVPRIVKAIPFVLIILAPFIFAEKLRFDLDHPKPYFRFVGSELPRLMPEGSKLYLLDPKGSGESFVLTRYELWDRRKELLAYRAAFHSFSEADVHQALDASNPDHLLVHSVRASVNAALGTSLQETGVSYLLRWDEPNSAWSVIHQWDWSVLPTFTK